jgi:hypothetical protein
MAPDDGGSLEAHAPAALPRLSRGGIDFELLVPLVLTANVIVAGSAWYLVGIFLR